MASAHVSLLNDIDERFLRCHICLNRLKDPKIFPCLHHYCRNCLDKVLKNILSEPREEDEEKNIECPVCRQKHQIPDNGVDGLKTDFNTKNIVEFIELYDSVKHVPSRVCINCCQNLEATGYCFRCNDFLCEKCHEHHLSSPIVRDHRPHIVSFNEAEAKHLTVEKLASLKEAPRCSTHPTKLSELCCSTCRNLPICVPCTYDAHKGHSLQEVSVLAGTERENLTTKVDELGRNNQKVYETQTMLNSATKILSRAVQAGITKLQEEHSDVEKEIKMKQLKNREIITKETEKVHAMLKGKISRRKQELDEEAKSAQDKYEEGCKDDQRQANILFAGLQGKYEAENAELQKQMESTGAKFRELLSSLHGEQLQHATRITQLSLPFNDIVRRFENATTMASIVLAAKDDWTDVQCIPDIDAAIDPLMKEVTEDITPELKTLTTVKVKSILSCFKRKAHITEKEESVVNIEGNSGWNVTDIAGSETGSVVVVTEEMNDHTKSFISVYDINGVQFRKDVYPSNPAYLFRFCDVLPGSRIVTACCPSEIGVYDEQNGRYDKTDVGHFVRRYHNGWFITCLAVDPLNHNIIVGCCKERDVYVFDEGVNHAGTFLLPISSSSGPIDLAVHGKDLLVCEYLSGAAYAVVMTGSVCEQLYEFSRPIVDGSTCSYALRVCIDGSSHIYMLWAQPGKVIAQYTSDGGQLLTTRSVDNAAECITTVITDKREKLIVATKETGKLYIYGLSFDIIL